MTWAVSWTRPAERDMKRLDRDVQQQVLDAVNLFAETGQGDVKKIQGTTDEYRLRKRDWRVRFTYSLNDAALIVLHVRHRREVYR